MLSCASARERHSVSAPPHACWPQLHGSRTIMWPSARNRFLLQCAMRLCDAAVSAACSHSTSCFHRSHQGAVDSSMRCVVVASCLVVAIPRWRSRHTPGLAGRPAVRAARNRIRESSMTPVRHGALRGQLVRVLVPGTTRAGDGIHHQWTNAIPNV